MIYLDMDEVICDLLGKLLNTYNHLYNKNVKIKDIKQWSLEPYIGKEGIELFKQPGFFADLDLIGDAASVIEHLRYIGKEIFIITSPVNEYSALDKCLWIKRYLPFFPVANLILVGNKGKLLSQIKDGILFDDCPEYLESFGGISVCMDMPYNKNTKCSHRIVDKDWWEFYRIARYYDNA